MIGTLTVFKPFVPSRPFAPSRPKALTGLALALFVSASACGDAGGTRTDDPAVAAAAATAAANADSLATSSDVTAIEVLDVADGSVTTLRDAVTGDRPVLVWFWAPH